VAIAKEEGAGADVVSGGELYCALKAGVEPSKIVYAGVGKTLQEITFAVEKDILMFNVESHMELDVLNEVVERLGKKVRVAIRVNPDVDPKTHPYISTGMKKSKFGIDIKQAKEEYRYARSLKNLEVVGIHCHIGSQILDVSPYIEAVEKVVRLYEELIKDGFDIKYIGPWGWFGHKVSTRPSKPRTRGLSQGNHAKLKGRPS
jgi:diaminopimelate decarboxylase